MEHFPTAPQESDIPQEAGPLADWSDEELGDEELAQFRREHPEGLELCANGDSILPRTIFELVSDLGKQNSEEARILVQHAADLDMLPVLSSDRIVSNLKGRSRGLAQLRREWLVAKERMSLRDGEREKNLVEQITIEMANEAIDRLRMQYELEPFLVEPDALRIVDRLPGRNMTERSLFFQFNQEVLVSDTSSTIEFLFHAFHEMTHFKSYGAARIDREEDGRFKEGNYRTGINVYSRDGKKRYLNALNEAVTEETSNRLISQIANDDPVFGPALRAYREAAAQLADEKPETFNDHMHQQYWVHPVEHRTPDGLDYELSSSYPAERVLMRNLFDKIIDRNPERSTGKTNEEAHEALFEMLQKAMFTGNILPFGRLFNDTFGRGKFREYGHLQTNEEIAAFIAGL